MRKLIKKLNNGEYLTFEGTDIEYALKKGFIYKEIKEPTLSLDELKSKKRQELRQARDNYLKENNYYFSDNDKFNIINLIDYTEEQKNNYIEFIKSDLKPQYDKWANIIETSKNAEELEKIIIVFKKVKTKGTSNDNTTK